MSKRPTLFNESAHAGHTTIPGKYVPVTRMSLRLPDQMKYGVMMSS